MSDFTIYIGNKNYSSWSLRGWLMIKESGAAFDEVVIPLTGTGQPNPEIHAQSPSGKVPALRHGDLVVWDSLAIGEYVAELFPEAHLWPEERSARAIARSMSAEMHSSFAALRAQCSMNLRREKPATLSPEVKTDVARIEAMWREARSRFGKGGPFLFGAFGIVDAMFAPVVTRFRSYGIPVDDVARAYMEAVEARSSMRAWREAARRETEVIAAYETK